MKVSYLTGRTFQLIGLLALPSAIWIAEFQKSEVLAISVLVGSVLVFFVGWIVAR